MNVQMKIEEMLNLAILHKIQSVGFNILQEQQKQIDYEKSKTK